MSPSGRVGRVLASPQSIRAAAEPHPARERCRPPRVRYTRGVTVCAFDAVIFDLDGVLLDSELIYLAATNEVLAREGRYLSPEENARYIGTRYYDMLLDIIPKLGLAHEPEHYIESTREAVARAFNGPLEPPPGA